MECDICLTKIKKQNRKKHEQMKKHKYYYSNLIIKKHNCKQDDDVCIELWFFTDLIYASHNHYFQLPKPMIERKICQIGDRNPNLRKILNKMPEPYKRHILTKPWCFHQDDRFGIIRNFLPATWMEKEPNIIN